LDQSTGAQCQDTDSVGRHGTVVFLFATTFSFPGRRWNVPDKIPQKST
jgi:hypothetical protein